VLGVMSQALIQFFWDDKSVTVGNFVSIQVFSFPLIFFFPFLSLKLRHQSTNLMDMSE
jgi:hypothetical protein